jgi:hypothetical protein
LDRATHSPIHTNLPLLQISGTLAPVISVTVITKKLSSAVYLTSWSALSSFYLPVIIVTACRSFFYHPPDFSDFRRTDWVTFYTHEEKQIPFNPEQHFETPIERENIAAIMKALEVFTPKCSRDYSRPPTPPGI